MNRYKAQYAPPFGPQDWIGLTHAAQDTLTAVGKLADHHFDKTVERSGQVWHPLVLEFVRAGCTHIHYPGERELPQAALVRRLHWLRHRRLVRWFPRTGWLYVRADVVAYLRERAARAA